MRVILTLGCIALGLVAAALQGLAVFWYGGYGGSFLSRAGLECTAVPVLVEIILFVVVMKNLDEVHARAIANPHSLLGQALRDAAARPPAPPPARDAWNGGFESMNDAGGKMGKER